MTFHIGIYIIHCLLTVSTAHELFMNKATHIHTHTQHALCHNYLSPSQPTLLASELLDMAASHCKVKEKEYFGLMTEGEG